MATISSPIDAAFYKAADDFFREPAGVALTYDDLTLATLYSEILPRDTVLETDLHPHLRLRLPIISARPVLSKGRPHWKAAPRLPASLLNAQVIEQCSNLRLNHEGHEGR